MSDEMRTDSFEDEQPIPNHFQMVVDGLAMVAEDYSDNAVVIREEPTVGGGHVQTITFYDAVRLVFALDGRILGIDLLKAA